MPPVRASVSVVICAYNEERHLGRLLTSLQRQTSPPTEVIVVDDGSTDRTAAVALEAGHARVMSVRHRGPARGRNIGAHAARGDVVVFLDGDMECTPGFIEALVAPIVRNDALGTFTRDIYVGNEHNRWAHAYSVIRQLGNGRLLPENFPDEWDNFRAIRRDAFLRVNGYDDVGYGEDRTLARKLGRTAVAALGAECFHFNPDSPSEIFSNGRWIGRGVQIREMRSPWRDHLPHRIARWLRRDLRELRLWTALVARICYHAGVTLGLVESAVRPSHHWK